MWDVLGYYGCDPSFITFLQGLHSNVQRCFRYAGCLPLSVVIFNHVLKHFLEQLTLIDGRSIFAFADGLTVVASSWGTLKEAFHKIQEFCMVTDLSNLDSMYFVRNLPS